MSGSAGQPQAVLVVRLSSFGDVVLSEPVTREIKSAFPDCRVVFATYDRYAGIARLMKCVDEVVAFSAGSAGPSADGGLGGIGFDAVVDLQNNFRSRRVIGHVRSRSVLRYRRQYLRRFLCVYLPWVWRGDLKHTVDLYLAALRPMGVRAQRSAPRLSPSPAAAAGLRRSLGEGPLVAVCPGASSNYKTWGRARFALLARNLRAGGSRVLVVGSETDRSEVEAVSAGAGDPWVTAHISDDVAAMAALLSVCGTTVSNDSGLMHLAAAVGSRVVGIFGPTSPILGFAPLGPQSRVVTRNAKCSPCSYHGNRPCKYKRQFCLEEIDPSEVAAVALDVAAGSRGG